MKIHPDNQIVSKGSWLGQMWRFSEDINRGQILNFVIGAMCQCLLITMHRGCKQKSVCTIYKERHPADLHRHKHSRNSKLGDYNNNSNENSMTCERTNMESRVVSMCMVPVKVRRSLWKGKHTYAMSDCCSQWTFINTDLAKKLKANGTWILLSKSKPWMGRIPKNLKQSVD